MVYICIIVTEDSVTAMTMKLRQLQQEKKREPRLHIISKRGHTQKMFNRMVSIPCIGRCVFFCSLANSKGGGGGYGGKKLC
jgi:hypothetical protein